MQKFLRSCRVFFGYAFFFSLFVNLLQLTFPIYMLQVYDRVLTSWNLSTLAVITVAAGIALTVMALLEWIRSRLLVRAGIEFDHLLSRDVLEHGLRTAGEQVGETASVRDVQTLRTFLGGNAVFAFFDLPWMPLYFLLIFVLHPLLGCVALAGGALVLVLGLLTERVTRTRLETATRLNAHAAAVTASALRNAGLVRALGMIGHVTQRWGAVNDAVIGLQTRASRNAGLIHAVSKALRVGLQVLIYAAGAYLAVRQESTPGAMIAASIIMGRALAPIDQAMATYKQSHEARAAYLRIRAAVGAPPGPGPMDLPPPQGEVTAEQLVFAPGGRPVLNGLSFRLPAGRTLAVIGPSASGKSTLCRLLLGVHRPTSGKVRLDRADIAAWNPEKLGPHLGWLPQDVELFAGTVAENIARLGPVDSDKVIAAARAAGLHELILGLPKGYDTPVGASEALSGGQRRRIGLARALYGDPCLVVLDEPDSHLDEEGEACLVRTLARLKERRTTVILVTHRPRLLHLADDVMLLQEGRIALCGPASQVLAELADRHAKQQEQRKKQQEQLQ